MFSSLFASVLERLTFVPAAESDGYNGQFFVRLLVVIVT